MPWRFTCREVFLLCALDTPTLTQRLTFD